MQKAENYSSSCDFIPGINTSGLWISWELLNCSKGIEFTLEQIAGISANYVALLA